MIGAASDPIFALEKLTREWPDVIVLDVEMPRMDGIAFLKKIMAAHLTPVVICSSLTEKGAETTMQALSAGTATVAQDEHSCVVFGMPKEAIKLGAAKRIVPLHEIHWVILGN